MKKTKLMSRIQNGDTPVGLDKAILLARSKGFSTCGEYDIKYSEEEDAMLITQEGTEDVTKVLDKDTYELMACDSKKYSASKKYSVVIGLSSTGEPKIIPVMEAESLTKIMEDTAKIKGVFEVMYLTRSTIDSINKALEDSEIDKVLTEKDFGMDKKFSTDKLKDLEYELSVLEDKKKRLERLGTDSDLARLHLDIMDVKKRIWEYKKTKSFSDSFKDESEMRDAVHNKMKIAHGDNYSEEVTNQVIDGILKDNPDAGLGEVFGRATSKVFSGKSKKFSIGDITESERNLMEAQRLIRGLSDETALELCNNVIDAIESKSDTRTEKKFSSKINWSELPTGTEIKLDDEPSKIYKVTKRGLNKGATDSSLIYLTSPGTIGLELSGDYLDQHANLSPTKKFSSKYKPFTC